MLSGVPQGSVLGLIICNFTLAYLTNDFFADPFFPKNPVLKNLKGKIRPIQVKRFIIGYADDLIIKIINQNEADYSLKKLISKLFKANLEINSEKTHTYDLSIKAKWDWLGYTFLALPKESLRYTKLISCGEKLLVKLIKSLKQYFYFILLILISLLLKKD